MINSCFYHQIKGTVMWTILTVVGSNLMVDCFEQKMFTILSQIYPKEFVDFFL